MKLKRICFETMTRTHLGHKASLEANDKLQLEFKDTHILVVTPELTYAYPLNKVAYLECAPLKK